MSDNTEQFGQIDPEILRGDAAFLMRAIHEQIGYATKDPNTLLALKHMADAAVSLYQLAELINTGDSIQSTVSATPGLSPTASAEAGLGDFKMPKDMPEILAIQGGIKIGETDFTLANRLETEIFKIAVTEQRGSGKLIDSSTINDIFWHDDRRSLFERREDLDDALFSLYKKGVLARIPDNSVRDENVPAGRGRTGQYYLNPNAEQVAADKLRVETRSGLLTIDEIDMTILDVLSAHPEGLEIRDLVPIIIDEFKDEPQKYSYDDIAWSIRKYLYYPMELVTKGRGSSKQKFFINEGAQDIIEIISQAWDESVEAD